MGVFEFVIVLVVVATIGKVASEWAKRPQAPPQVGSGEERALGEAIDELNRRLMVLEEERDFYKDLLDAPEPRRGIRPPDPPRSTSDDSA